MSDKLPYPLRLLTTAGVITAIAYTIGAAYSFGFYGRVGLDNLNLLGFGVEDHVLNSYSALNTLFRLAAWPNLAAASVGLVIAVLTGFQQRVPPWPWLVGLIVAASALALVGWVAEPVGGGLLVFAGLAILAASCIVILATRKRRGDEPDGVEPDEPQPAAAGGERDLLASVRHAAPYVAIGLCAVVGWRVLIGAAAEAGELQACEIAYGDDSVTPFVELVTAERIVEASGLVQVAALEGDPSQFRIFNVRLFDTTPAGVIIYADDALPEDLIFIPSSQVMSISIGYDGGNVAAPDPPWCR